MTDDYFEQLERELEEKYADSYKADKVENEEKKSEAGKEIIERRSHERTIRIPKKTKRSGTMIPILFALFIIYAFARFKDRTGKDFIPELIAAKLVDKQQYQNGTGNINDRVYLSQDMTKVTIYYDDGKKSKIYDFSEEARNYYTQILENNTFPSKNAQAIVICALMTLNKFIKYVYGGGSCQMDIKGKSYDCSAWTSEAFYLATGRMPKRVDTVTLKNGGEQISVDKCQPGDLMIKTGKGGSGDHVQISLGYIMFEGKKQRCVIHCSSGKGVNVKADSGYPICVRHNLCKDDKVLLSKGDKGKTEFDGSDSDEYLIVRNNNLGEER